MAPNGAVNPPNLNSVTIWGSIRGKWQQVHEGYHPPPGSTKVKNAWSFAFTPPTYLHDVAAVHLVSVSWMPSLFRTVIYFFFDKNVMGVFTADNGMYRCRKYVQKTFRRSHIPEGQVTNR
jgi:hypothetical protein